MKFKYRLERSSFLGEVYRPVARIFFQKGKDWIPVNAYVDSGADFILIPYLFGKFLGLKKGKDTHEIQGVNGVIKVIFKNVNVMIGKHRFRAKIAWSQVEDIPTLIGRLDVFNRFRVCFDDKEKTVSFTPKKI